MRLPRSRFTVRRMLVAVAITALAVEAETWRRRLPYCRQQAARCEMASAAHLWLAESHRKISALYRHPPPGSRVRYSIEQSAFYALAAWGEQGKAKRATERGEGFRRAAMYPWLSMPAEWTDPLRLPEPRPGDDESVGSQPLVPRVFSGH